MRLFELTRDLAAVRLPSAISGRPGRAAGCGCRRRGPGAGRLSAPASGPEAIIFTDAVGRPVDTEGKAGKADENEAKTLRIAEYYRSERHPTDARQQVGKPPSGDPRCPARHDRKSICRRSEP
jgi:hypothetical protein